MPKPEAVQLDIFGPERGGKSDLACSISLYDRSGPTHYLSLDHNYRAPVRRYLSMGAKIQVYPFAYHLPFAPPTSPKEKDFQSKVDAIAKAVRPVYSSFKTTLWSILKSKPGPIIIDNGTVLHYLCRLSCFGYIHKVPRHLYAKRTNEMSTIINEIRYSGRNVAWIHRWQEIWDDSTDKPTGQFRRAGAFEPIAYEVDATIAAQYDDERGKFVAEIQDSTWGAHQIGKRFVGKRRTFENIATYLLAEGEAE